MAQSSINTVVLAGNLVRDAELKYSNSGLAILEFAIAINDQKKQGDNWVDEVHYFDITVFGRRAEALQRFLTKGKPVGIEGKLKQDRWQTPEGQNRSKVGIIANNVMLFGGRDGGGAGGSSPGSRGGDDRYQQGSSSGQNHGGGGSSSDDSFGEDDFPDGIPF